MSITREEVMEIFFPERAKPKLLTLTVSPRLAEAIKANPDSLRLYVKGADGVVWFERVMSDLAKKEREERRVASAQEVLRNMRSKMEGGSRI